MREEPERTERLDPRDAVGEARRLKEEGCSLRCLGLSGAALVLLVLIALAIWLLL